MAKLGFQFAPIDLSIIGHPKAFAAGIEAFGLWAWSVTYVTAYNTRGVIPRNAAMSALHGENNAELASRLVKSGLWIELPGGDFEVWNHEKKSAKRDENGKTSGARRQQRLRDKAKAANDTVTDASRNASRESSTPVTRGVIPSPLSDLPTSSDLSLGRSDLPDRSPWPEWVEPTVAAVAGPTGETLDVPTIWLAYEGKAIGLGRTPNRGEFQKFVASWASNQKKDRVREREREDKRPKGGGPRGDRQPLGGWQPTGTEGGGEF
jgi:hypothetical protein